MKLDIFTLFPEAFDWFRVAALGQNALEQGNELRFFNYRDTTPLGAGQVDDAPYGGGAGMVLRVDVVDAALQAAYANGERPADRACSRPTGRLLDDELADELTAEPHVALLCGRYEGFDERVHEHLADDEVSIGRYVLAGGELPAMVVADVRDAQAAGGARARAERRRGVVQPGAGGGAGVPALHPPAPYRGWGVPDVLVSGDHERVREWRVAAEPRPSRAVRKRSRVGTIPPPRGARIRVRRFFLAAELGA